MVKAEKNTKTYNFHGVQLTVKEIATFTNRPVKYIRDTIKLGLLNTFEFLPPEAYITYNGKTLSLTKWALELNIPLEVLEKRLSKGLIGNDLFNENIL